MMMIPSECELHEGGVICFIHCCIHIASSSDQNLGDTQ